MQGIGWDGANEKSYLPTEIIEDGGERQEIFRYDSSGASFSSGSPLMVWDSSEPSLSPLHPLAEEHVPSSERQWWPVEFVGAEKGAVAVGTCKSRVTQSVTAILRRRKAVFTRNSEGIASRSCQKSGEGRWAGGAGQAENQEVSILRTRTRYVQRGGAQC